VAKIKNVVAANLFDKLKLSFQAQVTVYLIVHPVNVRLTRKAIASISAWPGGKIVQEYLALMFLNLYPPVEHQMDRLHVPRHLCIREIHPMAFKIFFIKGEKVGETEFGNIVKLPDLV
jgi:hypothetical protein